MVKVEIIDMSIEKKNKKSKHGWLAVLDFIQKNKLVSLLGVLAVLLFFMGIIALFINNNPAQNQAVQIIPSEENSNEQGGGIYIDLSGAVERPGLYHLSSDSRVNDLLVAAGGLSVDANRDWVSKSINLAQKLTDGVKIYIPSMNNNGQSSFDNNSIAGAAQSMININLVSQSELERLPKIGPATAQKIISYRSKNGPFSKKEDIILVSGIGDKTYEELKDLITVY